MTVRPTSVKRSRARLTEEIVAKTFWDDLAAIGKTIPKSESGLRAEPSVTVWPLTPELFDDALALFKARPDQRYSLTDCASMVVSHRLNVTQILTADRDFENEGFEILL